MLIANISNGDPEFVIWVTSSLLPDEQNDDPGEGFPCPGSWFSRAVASTRGWPLREMI
jgi:hypothetical protein